MRANRTCFALLSAMITMLAVVPATAQDSATATQPSGEAAAARRYEGGWSDWPKMTGDWGGTRTWLEDRGIRLEYDMTQIFQNNAHGGYQTDNGSRYSGSGDLTLTLDSQKMGLWPAGTIVLNAEPKWGNGINSKVGSLLPVNFDAYKPSLDDCVMALSEWFIIQGVYQGPAGKAAIILGKVDLGRAFDANAFANDERTQFLNVGFRNDPQLGHVVGYTPLAAALVYLPTDWLTTLTAIGDADGRATQTGFNTAFHGDAENFAVAHEWQIKVKPFGLPGTQRIAFGWSPKNLDYVNPRSPFSELSPLLIELAGMPTVNKLSPYLPYGRSKDNVVVWYNFDQYLYTEADDPTQGFGLFGRFGWAREDVNPVNLFYSIGVGGKGIVPSRDNDRFGVGYFCADLSDRLPPVLFGEQGIECFYNIQVTPWMTFTPDLQVIINPGGMKEYDTAVVWGFRVQMSL